jgi:hypothetical protein
MTFERAERSVRRAELQRDLALREGRTGKARAWEVIANLRSRRFNGGVAGSRARAETQPLADVPGSGFEEGAHSPVEFPIEGAVATGDQTQLGPGPQMS